MWTVSYLLFISEKRNVTCRDLKPQVILHREESLFNDGCVALYRENTTVFVRPEALDSSAVLYLKGNLFTCLLSIQNLACYRLFDILCQGGSV